MTARRAMRRAMECLSEKGKNGTNTPAFVPFFMQEVPVVVNAFGQSAASMDAA